MKAFCPNICRCEDWQIFRSKSWYTFSFTSIIKSRSWKEKWFLALWERCQSRRDFLSINSDEKLSAATFAFLDGRIITTWDRADVPRDNSIYRTRAPPSRSHIGKLPMFTNTIIAGGSWLMLPTAGACLIYRGRSPRPRKIVGTPLDPTFPSLSRPFLTCRCSDASLLPVGHAPLCPPAPCRSARLWIVRRNDPRRTL